MKAWRNIYCLTLLLGMFVAWLPESARVLSQNFAASPLEPANFSVNLETRKPLENTFAELKSTFLIKDPTYALAYFDVIGILSEKNSCTDFFSGSDKALEVFNELAPMMTRTYTSQNLGIRMSGRYTIMSNNASGTRYRLFRKAEINSRGAFYHQKIFDTEAYVPSVGSFAPNTRAARALMLLHELGHLIEVLPGHWLLPDDGANATLSQENTRTVEKHCAESIKGLSKSNSVDPARHQTQPSNMQKAQTLF